MSKKRNVIYCNCCGRPICPKGQKDKTSYLHINKEWGYFSNEKDGTIHSIDMCEACYENFVKSLVIPPEIKQTTEFV